MEKYINESNREVFRGATEDTEFSDSLFNDVPDNYGYVNQVAFHSNLGSITVLDRLTGFGDCIRDTETGYRDPNGKFWLASGMMDVRTSGSKTIGEAIAWIKKNANTCIPDRDSRQMENGK